MKNLLSNLKAFNRKERFYVVDAATEGGFKLSKEFKRTLNEHLKAGDQIGDVKDAFVAMDYHFDWIYASLFLSKTKQEPPFSNDMKLNANQEDVDLLIAYPDSHKPGRIHLILIEAKGDTSWANSQAGSKANRLKAIFGDDGRKWGDMVVPHYFIWSPRETKLNAECFPDWAKKEKGEFSHLLMNMGDGHKRIVRCDDAGKASAKSDHWIVK